MKITLDTNCIIDLEENRAPAGALRGLIQRHERGELVLRVVGISASEQQQDGLYAETFEVFRRKLERAGLGGAEILKPIAHYGVTYYDWCIYADDTMEQGERQIHEILFPDVKFSYTDYCQARGLVPSEGSFDWKWRNAKCDVLAIWSHIHCGGDIFVTSDSNFLSERKKSALEALGAGVICRATDAVRLVTGSTGS